MSCDYNDYNQNKSHTFLKNSPNCIRRQMQKPEHMVELRDIAGYKLTQIGEFLVRATDQWPVLGEMFKRYDLFISADHTKSKIHAYGNKEDVAIELVSILADHGVTLRDLEECLRKIGVKFVSLM